MGEGQVPKGLICFVKVIFMFLSDNYRVPTETAPDMLGLFPHLIFRAEL